MYSYYFFLLQFSLFPNKLTLNYFRMAGSHEKGLYHQREKTFGSRRNRTQSEALSTTPWPLGQVIGDGKFAILTNSFQIRSPFNLVLINLVFAEFLISVYGIPVDLTCIVQRGYRLGHGFCNATGFILTLSGSCEG